jgi:hypothetical protein
MGLALRGNLRAQLASDFKSGEFAVATAVRRRTHALKANVRKQMQGAGLGKLANLVRDHVDPARGGSLNAHGTVDARSFGKRPGGPPDPLSVFDEGAEITTVGGHPFLVIWKPAAGRRGNRRTTMRDLAGQLTLLKFRSGRGFVAVFKGTSTAAFLLVPPPVHVRKRLDLDALLAKAGDGIDALVASDWERRDQQFQARVS